MAVRIKPRHIEFFLYDHNGQTLIYRPLAYLSLIWLKRNVADKIKRDLFASTLPAILIYVFNITATNKLEFTNHWQVCH